MGRKIKGSMPMILFLFMGCIMAAFYYYDKNIIAGAAYETAVVGSTKAREKNGISKGELESLFSQRMGEKCILFNKVSAEISVKEKEIEVSARAVKRYMEVSVLKRAAVTKPEEKIRTMQRLK